jgi:site-specific recombinase XerC
VPSISEVLVQPGAGALTPAGPAVRRGGLGEELDDQPAPGVKQQLAAIRMLFDWLVIGQVVPVNPAAAVRGRSMS